jgi:hypothetical protein
MDKWTSGSDSGGLKMSKNTFFGTFPRVFGKGHFFGSNYNIFSTPFHGFGQLSTDIIASGLALWCNFCLCTAQSAAFPDALFGKHP